MILKGLLADLYEGTACGRVEARQRQLAPPAECGRGRGGEEQTEAACLPHVLCHPCLCATGLQHGWDHPAVMSKVRCRYKSQIAGQGCVEQLCLAQWCWTVNEWLLKSNPCSILQVIGT